ncbi:MAG: BrnA antitoxin family protein [Acidobacteriota bacterium]
MPAPRNLKQIPKFDSEDEERRFWEREDSADYIDWKQARRVSLPKLKPSTKTISLRIPESLLENLKILANKRDVPYQSLLKVFLAERVAQELRAAGKGSKPPRHREHRVRS